MVPPDNGKLAYRVELLLEIKEEARNVADRNRAKYLDHLKELLRAYCTMYHSGDPEDDPIWEMLPNDEGEDDEHRARHKQE